MPGRRTTACCRPTSGGRRRRALVASALGTGLAVSMALPGAAATPTTTAATPAATTASASAITPTPGTIAVSVATLWMSPKAPRRIDADALTYPVRIRAWTRSLSYAARLELHHRIYTQALLGAHVMIVGARRDWLQVRVVSQVGSYFPTGITGWVPARQVRAGTMAVTGRLASVVARTTRLRRHDATRHDPGMRTSYATRLPVTHVGRHRVWVRVPGWQRSGWLPRPGVAVRKPGVPAVRPTRRHIVTQARKFRGLPFLWAGMSSFGYDCAGLAWTVYRQAGIALPRDASDQAKLGRKVHRSELRRGDLVFFSSDGTRTGVHHTAIYAGRGRIIQAPHTGARVSLARLNGYDDREYWGARRYLHH